jgi:hypothetical protein
MDAKAHRAAYRSIVDPPHRHNEQQSYGTKTREWQLDIVALLERVELPAADIAFKIRFTKARERTPDNRADFDEAIITLADDTWSSERSTHVRTAKPTKPQAADRVFELLAEAIAIDGEVVPSNRHVPPDARGVRLDTWRRYCEAGCISEGDPDPVKKAAADRKAFWRASNHLLAARRVGSGASGCGSRDAGTAPLGQSMSRTCPDHCPGHGTGQQPTPLWGGCPVPLSHGGLGARSWLVANGSRSFEVFAAPGTTVWPRVVRRSRSSRRAARQRWDTVRDMSPAVKLRPRANDLIGIATRRDHGRGWP